MKTGVCDGGEVCFICRDGGILHGLAGRNKQVLGSWRKWIRLSDENNELHLTNKVHQRPFSHLISSTLPSPHPCLPLLHIHSSPVELANPLPLPLPPSSVSLCVLFLLCSHLLLLFYPFLPENWPLISISAAAAAGSHRKRAQNTRLWMRSASL